MCTMPRQLLPSVFGAQAYPHGLRSTLMLPACPNTTVINTSMANELVLAVCFRRKIHYSHSVCESMPRREFKCEYMLQSACQKSHSCKLLHNMLLHSAAESYCWPSVTTCEGEQTVNLNQFQLSHTTTPTAYCRGTTA